MASVEQIIGKVNPLLYAENGKELLKKYGSPEKIPASEIKPKLLNIKTDEGDIDLTYYFGKDSNDPVSEHKLVYQSTAEAIESIYFFILDLLQEGGYSIEKLIDNFTSTPGGSHFSEVGLKSARLQEEASKIMGNINVVVKSILNIVYDLKEFKMRLQAYDNLRSKDPEVRKSALLSLKQIWLDKVDIQKGNTSIKMMTFGQGGFTTLLDAFLVVENEHDVSKLDLNDRVKRVLYSRIAEFNIWLKESEAELRKRYALQKSYLKSQMSSLKLYIRWVRPYLKTINQLEMKDRKRDASLINVFNTVVFEIVLLGKKSVSIESGIAEGFLPTSFSKIKPRRKYYSCILVSFNFRGIPRQGAPFVGRSEVTFKGYALNEDELKKLDEELEKDDLNEAFKLVEEATNESIEALLEEVKSFLDEKDENNDSGSSESNKKKKVSDEVFSPFKGLVEPFKGLKIKKESSSDKTKNYLEEEWYEKEYLRPMAANSAVMMAFKFFEIYKKAHGMPAYP